MSSKLVSNSFEGHTFLITGGAGFIGSHLADRLLALGAAKVRVVDNLFNGSLDNIGHLSTLGSFEFLKGDIVEIDVCRTALRGVDYVFHQAAVASVPRSLDDPLTTHKVNVDGFLNLLVAAREAKVRRVIYASSSSVYGDNVQVQKKETDTGNLLSPYAISKLTNELYAYVFAQQFGMEIVGLRYFNVFGPRQKKNDAYAAVVPLFISSILEGSQPVIYGDGEQTRDFTFVDNVVDANVRALMADKLSASGHVFNIACGQATSVNRLFTILQKMSGANLKPIYKDPRPGEIRNSLADISKAKKILGYEPQINTEMGLQTSFAWYSKKAQVVK